MVSQYREEGMILTFVGERRNFFVKLVERSLSSLDILGSNRSRLLENFDQT